MKRSAKKIIKISIFLMILVIIWFFLNFIFLRRNDGNWYGGGITRSYENQYYYDAIFSGTSMVLANVNMEKLYLKYGIAGLTTGEPEQPVYLSYYTLEEVLKYQHPQVVFFDVRALFYSDELIRNRINLDENLYLHYTIDQMKNSQVKYETYQAAKEIVDDLDIWDYFSRMYYNHSNWENVKKINFQRELEVINRINGNTTLFDIEDNLERKVPIEDIYNEGECEEISEFNLKYFLKIIDLCKKKNIDLVLLRGHTEIEWTWKQYNTISDIAEKNVLDYLDINLCEKEIGFDWRLDSADGGHLNVLGSQKWTDYIGNYIKENYDIKDHRYNLQNKEFVEQEEKYYSILNAMQDKAEFLKKLTFDQYITELQRNDMKNNNVYIIVSRKIYDQLDDAVKEKLYNDEYNISIKNNEEINGEENNGLRYLDKETVEINSKQSGLYSKGVNIIIFNSYINQIISDVYFDFSGSNNPNTCRVIDGRFNEEETGINTWSELN